MKVVREICKTIVLLALMMLPLLMVKVTGVNYFLWLYVFSIAGASSVLSYYSDSSDEKTGHEKEK